MAQVSFDSIANSTSTTRGEAGSSVKYFSIKDGEECLVRFLHSSTNDFDIHTVHEIHEEGKKGPTLYECTRTPYDPIESCDLCVKGATLKQKIFVHMIKYERNDNGGVTPIVCAWVKPSGFARELKDLLDNYGSLEEHIFKIKRTGSGLDTRYTSPMYVPPAMLPKDMSYDPNAFSGWSPVGSMIRKNNITSSSAPSFNAPQGDYYANAPETVGTPTHNYSDERVAPQVTASNSNGDAPQASPAERFPAARPWEKVAPSAPQGGSFTPVNRPNRY